MTLHRASAAHPSRAPKGSGHSGNFSRLFDNRFNAWSVRVAPGDYYVTAEPDEMIVTVLGSCVSACVRNPRTGFGGLNHFMLPESGSGEWNGVNASMRYGNYAMEALINEVLKSGCQRHELDIKLFGGANFNDGSTMVGSHNSRFAIEYLRAEGLRIGSTDLGGRHGRRIHFFPATGVVRRLLLKSEADRSVVAEERQYVSKLARLPVEGEIDLF
ncbi:chemoreceptor glutamine deamidase CheD [Oryzibacter oryziterrae]|uniref:chemoreceptor glutamine deamidase CheD n=1 Tax=Oryzibacter oryziterrae TaxID=2766474 RepID=UPI001F218DF0|nr:chemoreceptor glutamine deamidase CheD [Oryzibacter oryziterrae]